MLMLVRRFAWLLLVALGGAALAQPAEPRGRTGLPGESPPIGRRLDRAQKLVEEKQYADAIDEFQRILDESGDALVPLPNGQDAKEQATRPRHCLHARRLCHQRLAALPPEALKLYRSRVDGQAKTLVEQALANHDLRLLERVVNEMFCSRPAEQAQNQLGDLAFERGDFDEAERWWGLLALPASESVEREARSAERKPDSALRAPRC